MTRLKSGRSLTIRLLLAALPLVAVVWLTAVRIRCDKLNPRLIQAIQSDDATAVVRLLQQGADPNARQSAAYTDPILVRLLHSVWDTSEPVDDWTQPRALILAFGRPNVQPAIVEAMLAAGADPNLNLHVLGFDLPVVSLAAADRRPVLLQSFVSHGADLRAVGSEGITSLMCAAEYGSTDNVRIVLRAGLDVNAHTDNGITALHGTTLAVKMPADYGRAMANAEILLADGADINARDAKGDTPLDYAVQRGETPLVQFFLSHTALVSADDRRRLQKVVPHSNKAIRSALHLLK